MIINSTRYILPIFLFVAIISCSTDKKEKTSNKVVEENQPNTERPNVIIMYVDDLGYADVGCYGAKGVKTPNIDKLAANGLRFTDAHSATATCTPSRYAMLTGNYAFRRKAAVLKGDAPLIIDPAAQTMPKMFQKAGYKTAAIGKWHLGLGDGFVDWNETIAPGPKEVGFDYSFLLPSTGDRVPSVYMENSNIIGLSADDPLYVDYNKKIGDRPTGEENPELRRVVADPQHNKTIINGVSRIGYMQGGKSAEWVDEDFPYVLTGKANSFIQSAGEQPFFLYYSFHDIHVPRLPHADFQGASEMGPRGDAIVQVDYVVGEIVKILEAQGKAQNTVIIFTSDNGPVLNDGYEDQAVQKLGDHKPNGIYRGGKYSIYEAGTRVPTIVSWPGTIEPGISKAMMNQVDFYGSFATMLEQQLDSAVIDTENQMQALLGKSKKGRSIMIEEAYTLAIREGKWKYIKASKAPRNLNWVTNDKDIEHGVSTEEQLFDLSQDPGETTNVAKQFPDIVTDLAQKLSKIEDKTSR